MKNWEVLPVGVGARLVLVGIVASSLACSGRSSVRSPFDGSGGSTSSGAEDPIRIEVQNINFNDITIWTVRSGQRVRLGRVTGKTDRSFQIGWNVAVPISFDVDVTGGRSCSTGQIGVDPNSTVWLQVPANVGTQQCRAGRR